MKKRDSGVCYFMMVLLMITMVNALRPSAATSVEIARNFQFPCNGTLGECMGAGAGLLADDEEYLMESDVSSRILATTNSISYGALQPGAVCQTAIYGDCNGLANPGSRPCTLYNKCQRSV